MAGNPPPTPRITWSQQMQGVVPVTPINRRDRARLSYSSSFWNLSNPRTPSQIARVRYRENEYFKLWRQGRRNEWEGPEWNLPVGDLPARRSGRWGGQAAIESPSVERRREAERDPIRYYPSAGASPPLGVAAPAQAALRRLRGASLVKILGFGGFGLAALLDVTSKQGAVNRVVMKTVIGDDGWASDDLKTEKNWQMSLMRAMHVVQLVRWSTLRGTPVTLEDALIDDNPNFFFMELMKQGDLQQAIGRAGNRGEKLPSRLLWKVFACLIRGCIAMRYPPRLSRIESRTEEDWNSQDGPAMLEQVPDAAVRASRDYDLIHFDLDPQNILVGDFDNLGHPAVPRFKVGPTACTHPTMIGGKFETVVDLHGWNQIADLGLAERNRADLLTDEDIWTTRQRGKSGFFLPEQYHEEWEWAGARPRDMQPPLQVAANYGSWSNVYHAAMCMHMLITLYTFPYPPQTVGPFNGQGLAQEYAVVGNIQDYRGIQVPPFYTNGARLVSEQGLDTRLRNLLLRCLAVIPASRPGLEELESWAGQVESNPGFFATIGGDLSSTDLADHFICRPRDPPPPTIPTIPVAQPVAREASGDRARSSTPDMW